jgi:hypothetical protein
MGDSDHGAAARSDPAEAAGLVELGMATKFTYNHIAQIN